MTPTPADDVVDLVLPPTLQETREAISALIGDVVEAKDWVKQQFEARKLGQFIDWPAVKEKQAEIAAIQGDIEALKQHAKAFREDEAMKLALATAEKNRIKAENLERQRVIQREAMAAKNDRRVKNADLQQRKSNAALTAVMRFVAEKHPEDTETVRAIADAARGAVQ